MLSTKRVRLALMALLVVATPALGADNKAGSPPPPSASAVHVALQIKPGLWEFTDTPKMTGDPIVSDTMMAHIPPAQRAQYIAETRAQMAAPHKARECMTQAKFEQRLSVNPADCALTMVSNTGSALDLRSRCQSESRGMKQVTEHRIFGSSPITVTSLLRAVTTRGSQSMTIETTEVGRWLAADCGSLKDNVIQQLP